MKIPSETHYSRWELLAIYFLVACSLGLAADIVTVCLQLPRPPVDYFTISIWIFIAGYLLRLSQLRIRAWRHRRWAAKYPTLALIEEMIPLLVTLVMLQLVVGVMAKDYLEDLEQLKGEDDHGKDQDTKEGMQ